MVRPPWFSPHLSSDACACSRSRASATTPKRYSRNGTQSQSRCPAASWRTAAPKRKPSAERSGEAVQPMELQPCPSLAACALQLLATAGRTSCLYRSPRRLVYLSRSSLLRPPAHATPSCGRCRLCELQNLKPRATCTSAPPPSSFYRLPRLLVRPLPPSLLLQTTALHLLLSRARASPPQMTA